MAPAPEPERAVHRLFEARADAQPSAPAIVSPDRTVSYAELDARSNRWARLLRRRGLGPGDLVGLLLERSVDAVTAILAVIKSGAAYVPIDPGHPAGRLNARRLRNQLPPYSLPCSKSERAIKERDRTSSKRERARRDRQRAIDDRERARSSPEHAIKECERAINDWERASNS